MDLYNKTKCGYFLTKYGNIKFIPNSMYKYNLFLCVINNNLTFFSLINFDFNKIYGKTDKNINKKIEILKYAQENDLQIYRINLKSPNYIYYIFNKENSDTILNIFFLNYIIRKDKELYKYYFGTIEKTLTTIFLIKKLQYIKESNKNILVMIFYQEYYGIISSELYEKYGITKDYFPNYKHLYIFLKKNGYVDLYFNNYSSYILKSYYTFYNKLLSHKKINKFKEKEIKNIESIRTIDLKIN